MMKKVLAALLILVVSLAAIPAAGATPEVLVYVDSRQVIFPDQAPYINPDGRTMVPVRFVAQELGAKVDWDNATQTVTIKRGDTVITLQIGESVAQVNGNPVTFDTKAKLTAQGRTMVPLRFVSEALGTKVDWIPQEWAVWIRTEENTSTVPKYDVPAKPFEPQATNAAVVIAHYVPVPNQDPSQIKISYISMDELPARVGPWTIYSMEITIDKIFVKQGGLFKPIDVVLDDGNFRLRQGTGKFETQVYTKSYPVQYSVDSIKGLPETDMTKVRYILLLADTASLGNEILAVENPLYKEGVK